MCSAAIMLWLLGMAALTDLGGVRHGASPWCEAWSSAAGLAPNSPPKTDPWAIKWLTGAPPVAAGHRLGGDLGEPRLHLAY